MIILMKVRDLRKAKREVDLRLVDREDQVEDLVQQVRKILIDIELLQNYVFLG